MRKTLIAASVLLFAACASAPKLAGRYGVVLDPLITDGYGVAPYDSIVNALRDRLSTVDVIVSPADDSYDAVIVLKSGATVRSNISQAAPDYRQPRVQLVHFEIIRAGASVTTGTARVDRIASTERSDKDLMPIAHGVPESYAAGIEVARQVVKALRAGG